MHARGCVCRNAWMVMWAPHTLPSQQLKLHNILNMEHPSLSHKNYMVDVTAVGGCYCAQRRFTGNTYIHHLCHRGLQKTRNME